MLNRIPTRLSLSILALLALIFATAVATGYYLAHYRRDARSIALVLRQAERAAALGSESAALGAGTDAQAGARLWRLRQSFERTHEALTQGGAAPIDEDTGDTSNGPPVSRQAELARLSVVKTEWDRLAKPLDELSASGGKNADALQAILAGQVGLRANLEATASMLRKHADDEIAQLFWIQAATTSAGSVLVLFILWGARRDIGLPLRRLVKAARDMAEGDRATPIDTSGLSEIAELAEELERLRQSLPT